MTNRLGSLPDRSPLNRLIIIRIGIDPFHVSILTPKWSRHSNGVNTNQVLSTNRNGSIQILDIIAAFVRDDYEHDIAFTITRATIHPTKIAVLFSRFINGRKDVLASRFIDGNILYRLDHFLRVIGWFS